MIDAAVKVQPDSTGKAVDTSELTRTDGTVVDRQRINLSDPILVDEHAKVFSGALSTDAKLDSEKVRLLGEIVLRLEMIIEKLR